MHSRHFQPFAGTRLPGPVRAFTLIELLTVIAIIGILAGIMIPVVGSVRGKARQAQCLSNLRQIGTGFQLYLNDNRGVYPDFATYGMYNWGGKYTSWGGPQKENRPLYPYITDTSVYRCPSDTGRYANDTRPTFFDISGNSYCMANSGQRGLLRATNIPGVFSQLEQPSRTILAFENTARSKELGYGTYWHKNACNLVMADGHVVAFTQQQIEAARNPTNPPGYTWGWSRWSGSQW
ncbi:hypothetical protein OPIT5_15450 [Opitutaceae bacterium TAV5]|nr:hypothetical protein OPIT5_15450 [Opitutaceae bacterium TAV5]